MANRKFFLHYLTLIGAIALSAILRFWHLDLKPLWLDEVITTLFTLGRSYNDVPLEVVFPLNRLEQIFTFNPTATCSQIAHTLATQSTHPPLFFCLMHHWIATPLVGVLAHKLSWTVRSLPALFGVSAIAAVYLLNTTAFFPAAGLWAAVVMAVSPYAVYLSQEARHYTLPLLLITLAILGLIKIQQDLFQRQQLRPSIWFFWAIINSIGLYVHYFFIIAFIAQLGTLLGLIFWRGAGILSANLIRNSTLAASLAIFSVIASFIPWLPVMLSHFNRSETSWLPQPHNIAPLYQTLASWILIVIALPVETQPLWIAIPAGLLMLLFGIWVARHIFTGLRQLWHSPSTHLATLTLLTFTVLVLLQFFAIVYLLKKDITIVPRYNFVYYPSIFALIGASLVKAKTQKAPKRNFYFLLFTASLLSCVFVVSNLVFQKPFEPDQVAQNMNQEPAVPLMVVMSYKNYQDVALGLSFALALEKVRSESTSEFAFFKRSPGYESVWQKLSQLPQPVTYSLNLWIVAPELKRRDYPPQLTLSNQATCILDSSQHYRIGVPYQLYRCRS